MAPLRFRPGPGGTQAGPGKEGSQPLYPGGFPKPPQSRYGLPLRAPGLRIGGKFLPPGRSRGTTPGRGGRSAGHASVVALEGAGDDREGAGDEARDVERPEAPSARCGRTHAPGGGKHVPGTREMRKDACPRVPAKCGRAYDLSPAPREMRKDACPLYPRDAEGRMPPGAREMRKGG